MTKSSQPKEPPCSGCGRISPHPQNWECSVTFCPRRKNTMHLPHSTQGPFEPIEGGYKTRPTNHE